MVGHAHSSCLKIPHGERAKLALGWVIHTNVVDDCVGSAFFTPWRVRHLVIFRHFAHVHPRSEVSVQHGDVFLEDVPECLIRAWIVIAKHVQPGAFRQGLAEGSVGEEGDPQDPALALIAGRPILDASGVTPMIAGTNECYISNAN
jgi:hypothetical protein